MAWALVKWIEVDRLSVIPSGWVANPTPLLVDSFLLKGYGMLLEKEDQYLAICSSFR